MQENQSTVIWTGASISESTLPDDSCYPQWFVSLSTDAVEKCLLIIDTLSTLSVIFGGVGSIDEPSSIVGYNNGGPLLVTVSVEDISSEPMDAGFVEQMEFDTTEKREELLLLILRQGGFHCCHDGKSPDDVDRSDQV